MKKKVIIRFLLHFYPKHMSGPTALPSPHTCNRSLLLILLNLFSNMQTFYVSKRDIILQTTFSRENGGALSSDWMRKMWVRRKRSRSCEQPCSLQVSLSAPEVDYAAPNIGITLNSNNYNLSKEKEGNPKFQKYGGSIISIGLTETV